MATLVPVPELSTQQANPWRATLRTVLATGVPAFISALYVLPTIIQYVLDGYGATLPDSARAWLLGAAALITATSGVITRILAIPAVIELTHKYIPAIAPASTK